MSPRNAFKVPKVVATHDVMSDVVLHYDYSRISAGSREQAQEIARSIKLAGQRIQQDRLLVATKLLEARDSDLFPEDEWLVWVREEFGLEPRNAQLLMNFARVYKDRADAQEKLSLMGDTVAMLVSQPSVPATVRAYVEEKFATGGPLTTRETKEIVQKKTFEEATEVITETLEDMDPQMQQRVLNSSTRKLRENLPEDVPYSDAVLTKALLSLRAERLATLQPLNEGGSAPDAIRPNYGLPKDAIFPPELEAAGWELKRIEATGEWYCVNTERSQATPKVGTYKRAIKMAYEAQRQWRERRHIEPVWVEVSMPVDMVKRLLGASIVGMPGLSDKEVKEFREYLGQSLAAVE